MRTLLLLVVLPSICLAASVTQTDWSGGGGVPGPVADWGDSFAASAGMSWLALPGELYLSSTPSTPIEHTIEGNFTYPGFVYPDDIDGDGDIDIMAVSRGGVSGDITWWANADGLGTSWVTHVVDDAFPNAFSICSADVDGDNDTDILGASRNDSDIAWWENTDGIGTMWTKYLVDDSFGGAYFVHAEDVDADGDMDVLGAAYTDDEITWWENTNGTGTAWTEHVIDGSVDAPTGVFTADINGDGHVDVLGSVEYANDILWWENTDGSGTNWIEHIVDGDYASAYSVYSADVDGDGDFDVLGASPAGYITWWANADGLGTTWVEHTIKSGFQQAYGIHAADLDGDGDIDVAGTAIMANNVAWWENSGGTGTIWVEHAVDSNFNGPQWVCSADLNGNGSLELISCAHYDFDVAWWGTSQFQGSGQLTSSILDTGVEPEWGQITWTESVPANTDLMVELRAGDSPGAMGSWLLMTGSGEAIPSYFDYLQYLQYRITLTSGSSAVSPCLEDITVDWTPFVGVEDEMEGISGFQLLNACPNPSTGDVQIGYSIPAETSVDLTVYDLSGRSMAGARMDSADGSHVFTLNGLAAGVYLVLMRAGEFEAAERFVVIE
jgi:hypothetical protein